MIHLKNIPEEAARLLGNAEAWDAVRSWLIEQRERLMVEAEELHGSQGDVYRKLGACAVIREFVMLIDDQGSGRRGAFPLSASRRPQLQTERKGVVS